MINTFFNFFARSIPIYLLLSQGWHNHLPLPFLCTPHQFCSVGASLPHSHYLGTHSSGRLWVSLQIRADKNTLRVGMLRGGLRESWFSIGFQGWMGFRLPGRKRKRSWKKAWKWRYQAGCRRVPEKMAEHEVMKTARGSRCWRGQVGARLGNTCPLWERNPPSRHSL